MGVQLLCFFLIIGIKLALGYDVFLSSSPDVVTNGDPVTLVCKVNPTLNLTRVTWSRKTTEIFTTGSEPTSVLPSNYDTFKPIAGRFFTTMIGLHEHHVILTANLALDHGLSWTCGDKRYQSNVLVMSVVSPTTGTTYCYDTVGCMLGVCTGVVFTFLLVLFAIALYRGQHTCLKHDKTSSDQRTHDKLERKENECVNVVLTENQEAPIIVYKL